MTLWSLWESRNDRVLENKHSDASTIVWTGSKFFSEWLAARSDGVIASSVANQPVQPPVSDSWTRPSPPDWVKCNVDASFSMAENKLGISVYRGRQRLYSCKNSLVLSPRGCPFRRNNGVVSSYSLGP